MNKNRIVRSYVNFSIVIGLYLLLATFLYTYRFGTEFYGLVTVTFMNVNFETYYETIPYYNMPFVTYTIFFVFNLGILIFLGRGKTIKQKSLKEVSVYNTVFTVLMIASQIVYVYMIPDRISGTITDKFVFTEFAYTSDVLIRAINLNYVLALLYVVYNVYVSVTTMPAKDKQNNSKDKELDEDKLLDQFIRG